MKAGLAGMMWFALAAGAFAQGEQKVVIAECDAGGACRCYLSDTTMNDAALALGTDLPADPDSFLLAGPDGSLTWSPITRNDLEIALGGGGTCPVELFQDWTPENGTWDGTTVLRGASGAPECSQIGAMAVGMMNSALGAATVDWGGRFDMNRFYAATGPEAGDDVPVWTETGPHTARGTGGGDGMTTAYDARLLTPRRFTLDTRISGEGCVFDLRSDVRKVN
ncbi:MAG: hypothetical protein MUC82_02805 [Cypionkella sp.]|jgi:hypothetical protein|nr:hypothetical protein [Cypionkella sp.]